MDSNNRVALLIIDPSCSVEDADVKFLIGCAPNKMKMKSNNCDLIKGHIEVGESPIDAVIREAKEECGIKFKISDIALLDIAPYADTGNDGVMALYYAKAPFSLTDENIKANCKCTSYYTQFGRQFPELCKYYAITISEANDRLYKKLVPFLQEIKKIKELDWNI